MKTFFRVIFSATAVYFFGNLALTSPHVSVAVVSAIFSAFFIVVTICEFIDDEQTEIDHRISKIESRIKGIITILALHEVQMDLQDSASRNRYTDIQHNVEFLANQIKAQEKKVVKKVK